MGDGALTLPAQLRCSGRAEISDASDRHVDNVVNRDGREVRDGERGAYASRSAPVFW